MKCSGSSLTVASPSASALMKRMNFTDLSKPRGCAVERAATLGHSFIFKGQRFCNGLILEFLVSLSESEHFVLEKSINLRLQFLKRGSVEVTHIRRGTKACHAPPCV